jgi:hypothetical protein
MTILLELDGGEFGGAFAPKKECCSERRQTAASRGGADNERRGGKTYGAHKQTSGGMSGSRG